MKNFIRIGFYLLASVSFALPFLATASTELRCCEVEMDIKECRSVVAAATANNPKVLASFDTLAIHLENYYLKKRGNFNLRSLLNAIAFAAEKHAGQIRDDGAETPYIIHPIGVCRILWEEGKVRNLNVLIAALLHDTLEDTQTTAKEIEKVFGARIRLTVQELTDDSKLSSEENKRQQIERAPFFSWNAQCIKLADRLYNIRDLRIATPNWSEESIARYFGWGRQLLEALRGTNEALEHALEKELIRFEACLQNHA